ncbi:zinc finger protein 688-like [Colius striatus]|uniref:zinc finger protein 688-like n=1 Tax=Colius striatus TaxID=57412 RepID=UPI002B1CE4AE|nr:zinc finger protein 688-like [Colius striatus]
MGGGAADHVVRGRARWSRSPERGLPGWAGLRPEARGDTAPPVEDCPPRVARPTSGPEPAGPASRPGAMAWPPQEPITFEDVAVYVSRAEWEAMAAAQRRLYRSVMGNNYRLLTSLGYRGPKPDLLHRLERREEPWGCSPQSPQSWDGPHSPSTGPGVDGSWKEEPPLGWWVEEPQERAQTPCQGWAVHWRLRCRRLLRQLGSSRGPAAAPGAGAGPVEPRERALPHRQGQDEDTKAAPREQPEHGSCAASARAEQGEAWLPRGRSAEAEAVQREHNYCARAVRWPRALRDHGYCRRRRGGGVARGDHGYCLPQRACRLLLRARAVLSWARRRGRVWSIIRRAKKTLWQRGARPGKRPIPPRRSPGAAAAAALAPGRGPTERAWAMEPGGGPGGSQRRLRSAEGLPQAQPHPQQGRGRRPSPWQSGHSPAPRGRSSCSPASRRPQDGAVDRGPELGSCAQRRLRLLSTIRSER